MAICFLMGFFKSLRVSWLCPQNYRVICMLYRSRSILRWEAGLNLNTELTSFCSSKVYYCIGITRSCCLKVVTAEDQILKFLAEFCMFLFMGVLNILRSLNILIPM